MTYDFSSIMDRHNMDACAVDGVGGHHFGMEPALPRDGFDVIPMWIADMNFPTCPSIVNALLERAKHPAYGYFSPRQAYFDGIIQWHKDRNGVSGLEQEHIGYENGVLGGVVSALNVLCSKGDHVLIHSPTYVGFTACVENNGYHIVHSSLVQDENQVWRMDFEDMERKIEEYHIHTAVFGSRRSPCGRVWERWELERAMALFEKHHIFVISDEIWSDLLLDGHRHIPTQSVNAYARQHTVALYAPSKTFNLAGLVGSYHIIYDPWLRDRMDKESSLSHYNQMNVLSMHALIGAYQPEGCAWVDQLCQALSRNIHYAVDFIREKLPGLSVSMPEGTYMLFVDCTGWCRRHGKSMDEVLHACWDVGVAVQDGRMFHGPCHIRMNLALPLSRVQEAFERLERYVFLP